MSTNALAQVPDTDHAGVITTDEFALVGMNDHIIDRSPVDVIALQATSASVPDFHSSILGASDHPLSFAMECNTSDVVRVTFEGDHGIGISRLDVKELDIIVASSSEESFVRSDAKAIDL
jgi:hypothetical protein